MARLRRVSLPGHLHLIIHRGRGGSPVFTDESDRQQYLSALFDASRREQVVVHGYGLADDQVRLLITPATDSGMARTMQQVGRRYVPAFNRRHGRTGTPWEGRFRSTVVDARDYFAACLRFVELLDGWSADPKKQQRPWSSMAHHIGARADAMIQDHPDFWRFGNTPFERESAYRRFVDEPVEPSIVAAILHAGVHGWALGDLQFASEATRLADRRLSKSPSGRPRHN